MVQPETKRAPIAYLCGPIENLSDAGHGWRDEIEQRWGDQIEFLNPLDRHDPIAEDFTIWDPRFEDEPDEPHLTVRDIVEDDLSSIDEADCLLVHWQTYDEGSPVPMAGTPMEMRYAWHRNMAVITRYAGTLGDVSPWARYHSDEMYSSFDECINHIINEVEEHRR